MTPEVQVVATESDPGFAIPPQLVAQRPAERRDASRLLHVRRHRTSEFESQTFSDLPRLLKPTDLLVRNVTRVLPARLEVVKDSGARCEVLLVEPAADGAWWSLVRPSRRLPAGSRARLAADGRVLEVRAEDTGGRRLVALPGGDLLDAAHALGAVPLPPYIRRAADGDDTERYQTVYAQVEGSVAAPTAGLHFTPNLLSHLERAGVEVADLVLHVGPGTFSPLRSDVAQHEMHWERLEIAATTRARIAEARASGRRIVAVGTTVVRALESLALSEKGLAGRDIELRRDADAWRGRTRLFIRPPFEFRGVDALITNFHLPDSTLLLLVQALAGAETIRAAYRQAVRQRYRFYSYGDAMLIE